MSICLRDGGKAEVIFRRYRVPGQSRRFFWGGGSLVVSVLPNGEMYVCMYVGRGKTVFSFPPKKRHFQ